jgi:hypothetical protein
MKKIILFIITFLPTKSLSTDNMKQLTVLMPDAVYDRLIKQGETESRKKSPMGAILIERGLNASEEAFPASRSLSDQKAQLSEEGE